MINTTRSLWRLVADISNVIGLRYFLYLVLLAFCGLLEGLTIASVVPLLTAIGIGEQGGGTAGLITQMVTELTGWLGFGMSVPGIALLMLLMLSISTLFFLAQAYVGISLQTGYVSYWQKRLLSSIFSAKWGLFLKERNGDLINSVVTETQRLGGAFYQLGLLLTGLFHACIYSVVALLLSPSATCLVIAGGLLLFLITRPLVKRAHRLGLGISHENAELQVRLGEFVGSAKLLKATATEKEAVVKLKDIVTKLRKHTLANGFDAQLVKGIFDFGAAMMIASILILSGGFFNIDAAVILAILAIFIRLIPKLTGLQQSLQSLSSSLPAVYVLNSISARIDSEHEHSSTGPLPVPLNSGPLALSLEGVAVSYEGIRVVSDIEMNIPAGACVALVGRSGAGKSTIVDAMLGLVPIEAGTIKVNGLDLKSLPLSGLRRRIGYMGQETLLHNTTIRDNILWGREDRSGEAVMFAAKQAAADGFISECAQGLETVVGERGGRLSGGQRQRLALARALMGTPGLLILDEAASALDAETDASVTEALKLLKGKVTMIIISHRPSSIRMADYVYVMDKGEMIESGIPSELSENDGHFSQLFLT